MKAQPQDPPATPAAIRLAELIVPALDGKGRKGTIATEWGRKTRVGVAAMIDGELEKERATAAALLAALQAIAPMWDNDNPLLTVYDTEINAARAAIASATGKPATKKAFRVNPQIGNSRNSISHYDGEATHKDGSEFWGLSTYRTKRDLAKAVKALKAEGYTEQ